MDDVRFASEHFQNLILSRDDVASLLRPLDSDFIASLLVNCFENKAYQKVKTHLLTESSISDDSLRNEHGRFMLHSSRLALLVISGLKILRRLLPAVSKQPSQVLAVRDSSVLRVVGC